MRELDRLGEAQDVERYRNHATGWRALSTVVALVVAVISTAPWGWIFFGAVAIAVWYPMVAAGKLATVRLRDDGLELVSPHHSTLVPWTLVTRVGFGTGRESADSSQTIRWRYDFACPPFPSNSRRSRFVVVELAERVRGWGRRVAIPAADPASADRAAADIAKRLVLPLDGPFR